MFEIILQVINVIFLIFTVLTMFLFFKVLLKLNSVLDLWIKINKK